MTRLLLLAALMSAAPVLAESDLPAARWANEQLPVPQQEKAATELMQELRCLVCQGQTIADSDAEMAGDMRALVRSRIAAGQSPQQVRKYLVERYGDWITYNPPVSPKTWPLWAAPLFLTVAGVWLLRKRLVRRREA